MLTDPSGRPYRPNEEQREALQAEFYRTNAVSQNKDADCGNNPKSASKSTSPQGGAEDESWTPDENTDQDDRQA